MAQASEEMNQTENKNWVKAGLCFYEVKEVLLDFVAGDWTETKPATDCDLSSILKFVIESRKYQQQQFGGLQKSAKTVHHDRNCYIHDRPQPKVTNKELNEFKRNILDLLKNRMLQNTGKTELAQRRIVEICKEEYIILPKDEYSARLSNIEGKLDTIETTENKKIPFLEKEIKDIGELLKKLESSGDNTKLETKFQMVEADLKEMISKLTVRVDKLESLVGEMMDKDKILQDQTEDNLYTFRRMGFIPTTQTEEAKKLLQEKRFVVIKGNPGEGKTSTALHLIDTDDYKNQRVVVKSPKQWKKVDTDCVKIVVLDDIFGQYEFEPTYLQEWIDHLRTIQKHVDEGKLQVIITVRDNILLKVHSKLKSFKLFFSDMSLVLSSEKLNDSDKMSILNGELKKNNKNMKVDDKEQCIANFKGLIGFPLCCYLFAGNRHLFDQGPKFFKNPKKFLMDNITNLKSDIFLSLAFHFCNGKKETEHLSPSHIKAPENYLRVLEDLALYLNISFNKSGMISKVQSYGPFIWHHKLVGHSLGDRCPVMIVKYVEPVYLKYKDNTSQNVFIPMSVYGPLAEQMVTVYEAVGQVLADTCPEVVVKYGDAGLFLESVMKAMQYLTQTDNSNSKKTAVKHLKDTANWDPKCDDASKALENAFSLQKYDVCDLLIQVGVSLAMKKFPGVVKFVSVESVKKAIQDVKAIDNWDPKCDDASKALEDAFSLQKYDVCDLLFQEGVSLTMKNFPGVVKFVSMESVKKAIQGMKYTDSWDPKCDDASEALEDAFSLQKYDVCDLLFQEGVSLTMKNFPGVVKFVSLESVKKAIQGMKNTDNWDPKCDDASKALEDVFSLQKFDVCDLLFQEGVSLTMKNFPGVVKFVSLESVKKAIQGMKNTDNWDPKCDDASKALEDVFSQQKFDVCDLLFQEGVSLTMKNFPVVVKFVSLESVKKAIQGMKYTDNWDPKCDDASEALEDAFSLQKFDVCDLLFQEGVSLTMKNFPGVVKFVSLESVKKAIQGMKYTDNWDPMCDDASKALEDVFRLQKFDVCYLLFQEGVSLTMKNFPGAVYSASNESVKKAIQHMKYTDNWDPKSGDASEALENAFRLQKYDVCDLLFQEGVSLTMKNFAVLLHSVSMEYFKKAIQHMKDTDNWDPKSGDASEALENAFGRQKYDVCDVLFQEGVLLTMKILPNVVNSVSLKYYKKAIDHVKYTDNWDPKCDDAVKALEKAYSEKNYDACDLLVEEGVCLKIMHLPHVLYTVSLEALEKLIERLKDTDNWDPKCDDASKALENAYRLQKYDVCDLLFQEEVSLTMKNFPGVVSSISMESVKKAIQDMKDTDIWDPKCDDASKALENAYRLQKYDVCDLLFQEGVSLTMKNFPGVVYSLRLEFVKKAIQGMKDTDIWNPKCEDASKGLKNAFGLQKYDVCDVLFQEGVSLTMKNFPGLLYNVSMQYLKKAIQNMKDTDNWDPMCDHASKALENAFGLQKYDVCDLLFQEGFSLTMNDLPSVVESVSLKSFKKLLEHLKDTGNWDPKCDNASKALAVAYHEEKYDVCDLLIDEGATLTMNHLLGVSYSESLESVIKAIQHMKDTMNWDPKCDGALKALEIAYTLQKYDICDLLVQEGVSLSMNNLLRMSHILALEGIKKVVQHLKGTKNWDPKSDDASKILLNAYSEQEYCVCDMLLQEGVMLTMKNLPGSLMSYSVSLKSVNKIIQHLKDTYNWDPKCEDASKALANAYRHHKYDVCDLLIQNGVLLSMKHFPHVLQYVSFNYVKKAVQHLKDTGEWDPKCDDASKALENAYNEQKYDVCDLLFQEGVSLTMKNLPGVVILGSLESVKKVIQHLKDTEQWDSSSQYAEKVLATAKFLGKINVGDVLICEGVNHPELDHESIYKFFQEQTKSVW